MARISIDVRDSDMAKVSKAFGGAVGVDLQSRIKEYLMLKLRQRVDSMSEATAVKDALLLVQRVEVS